MNRQRVRMMLPSKHMLLWVQSSFCYGCDRCASRTSGSSATASSPRSSSGPARSSGAACRASTPSPSSRRCSTSGDGGSLPGRAGGRQRRASQRYLDNTNVLETTFDDGGRARSASSTSRRASCSYDRTFRPTQLVRIVEPLARHAARSACAASRGWAGRKQPATQTAGLQPPPLRGFPAPAPPHHRHPALLPRGPARSRSPSGGTSC